MDTFCLGFVTALAAFISLDSLRRLYVERHRLIKEDLNDYDLSFVWRIVIFLVYPLLNLFALWSSIAACQWFGGYAKSISYGLLWYHVVPAELFSKSCLLPVLFSGEIVQVLLILLALPALLFRPHPFLVALIAYSCTFVLGVNLIVDPLLSILGLGSAHWQTAVAVASAKELMVLAVAHALLAVLFLIVISNQVVQRAFAKLIRPIAVEKLEDALSGNNAGNDINSVNLCRLILLYETAGLRKQAHKELRKTKNGYPDDLCVSFTEAYLLYRRHKYKHASQLFVAAYDNCPPSSNELKSMLLAAAACCTHALRQYEAALNLVERALEFDYNCPVARMIKMDILLRQGKEQKAAEELRTAIFIGLNQNMEHLTPVDWQRALKLIEEIDMSKFLSTIGKK